MATTVTDRLFGENSSVAVKAPVRTVTTGANITLSGLQTIGGITLAEGDRVLVKDQTDATQNGIYNASAIAWTRSGDFDGNNEAVQGTLVVAVLGSGILLYQVSSANPVTIGSSAITFSTFTTVGSSSDVRQYGAVGDGATDSTAALLAAIAALSPGGELVFEPNGVYMVHVNGNHTLLFTNKTNFKIRGNNATIKVFNADPVAANDEILFFTGCTDGTVEDLIVDGNRANRTPAVTTANSIDIRTNCARLTFRKVRSINACMDGWTIETSTEGVQASYPDTIVLEDCEGTNAYRNGLSLTATQRCKIIRGRYTSANGTAPQNGIDVEPNTTTTFGNSDLLIEDVEVTGNTGAGLSIGGSVVQNSRVKVTGLYGNGNSGSFLSITNCNDLQVSGTLVGPHTSVTRGVIDIGTGTQVDVSLINTSFVPMASLAATKYLIYDQGTVTGRLLIDGVKANNPACKALITSSDATVRNIQIVGVTGDPAVQVIGGVSDYKNITVDTATGRGFYASVPVDVDGMTLIDCASTTAAGQFDTGSAGAVVRNVVVRQRAAIPGGAVGLYFNTIPAVVQNVKCVSAGVDYTAANSINFFGGTTGATIQGITPNPFSASPNVTPGTVANGASYNQTVAIAGVAIGDFVSVSPGVALQGCCFSAAVDSAGNVKLAISNTTGTGCTFAASTWKVSVDKRA